MIVNETQGDVFDELVAGQAIAHGANCKGVMGAGVAKGIKQLFPHNFSRYKDACDRGLFVPGDVLYTNEIGVGVYNLATQFYPGPDARLKYIEEAARKASVLAMINDHSVIKTVRIGSGIGGLKWSDVRAVLESIESQVVLEVYSL